MSSAAENAEAVQCFANLRPTVYIGSDFRFMQARLFNKAVARGSSTIRLKAQLSRQAHATNKKKNKGKRI